VSLEVNIMFSRSSFSLSVAVGTTVVMLAASAHAQSTVPTTTTLGLRANGKLVKKVAKGTTVQLVAQVQSPTAPLTSGQVRFCDASAPNCNDLHSLGIAQITPAGTATLALIPGIGVKAYRAEFLGVATRYQPSVSTSTPLNVNGLVPTTTTLSVTGTPGSYTLSATVVGAGSAQPLSGAVHFTQADPNNTLAPIALGDASVGSSTTGLRLAFAANSYLANPYNGPGVGDFNGDGVPDVVTNGYSQDASGNGVYGIKVLLGNGAGSFVTPGNNLPVPGLPGAISSFLIADFNGDGLQDVAAVDASDGYLVVALGNGDGTLQSPTITPGTSGFNSFLLGDFNHDGIADLATTSYSTQLTILLGNGNGSFQQRSATLPDGTTPVVVADVNGDGLQDILALSRTGIVTLLGQADGTFSNAHTTTIAAQSFIAGDFNADGKVDLAVTNADYANANYTVSILFGAGDGSFAPGQVISFTDANLPNALALTDINQDGIEDIAVATSSNVQGTGYQTVLIGNATGNFNRIAIALPKPYTGGQSYTSIRSADMNGDGLPDLIVGPGVLLNKISETAQAQITGVAANSSGSQSAQATTALAAPYRNSTSPTVQLPQ
jgi:hypothetical protein